MRLTDLQDFILRNRRKLIIALFFFVLLLIAAAAIYQRFIATPPVPEEEKLPPFTLVNETGSIVGEVSLALLPTVEFPKEITTYRVAPLALTFTGEEAKNLAARFGFSGEPRQAASGEDQGEFLTFIDTEIEASLMVITKPRGLTYVVEEGGSSKGILYDTATAIVKAKEFMEEKGLPVSQLSPFEVRHLNSDGSIYFEVADPAEAAFLELSFVWKVEERELLGEGPTNVAARVIFDRQGKVISLKFRFPDLQSTRFSEVKLLSFSKAVAKLKKEGLVVSTSAIGTTTGWSEIADLRSFAPESVRLVFVQPSGAAFLYPVYLFEGKGRTTAGTEVKASVYLLAVSPEYLKTED